MKILVLISLFLLVACGPSEEEKQNVAIITCNIMEESNNMDAAMRIKEINEARESDQKDGEGGGSEEDERRVLEGKR